jgi:hypothetical protein
MKVRATPAFGGIVSGYALVIVSGLALTALAADEKKAEGSKYAILEPFAQLAGEWEGKEASGQKLEQDLRVQYKVTSAGSAVVETMLPGTPHEMVTVIHPDGDHLVLTHYCALGNQPRMKAKGKGDGNQVAFKFDSATNLKNENDAHMHEVTYTFVDKDTLKSEWTHYDQGKASGTVVFELKRKK